jgi:hypothetical protein
MTVKQVMGAPSDIINIMIGTIVFFIALPGITPLIANWLAKKREAKEAAAVPAAAGVTCSVKNPLRIHFISLGKRAGRRGASSTRLLIGDAVRFRQRSDEGLSCFSGCPSFC